MMKKNWQQKTRPGKKLLALLLCGVLSGTAALPAIAAETAEEETVSDSTADAATAEATDENVTAAAPEEEATAAAPEETPTDATSPFALTFWRTAYIYNGTLDSTLTIPVYQSEAEPDVPYVPISTLVNAGLENNLLDPASFEWDGDVYRIVRNDAAIEVDLANQTVNYPDFYGFMGASLKNGVPLGVVYPMECISLRVSEKNKSSVTETTPFSVDLSKYAGARAIRQNDEVLMPLCYVQNLFLAPEMCASYVFNGDDIYEVVSSADDLYGNEANSASYNPYSNKFYSGSFCSRVELSDAYAKYSYGSMCLLLDLTYGHKEEKGIADFDSYLEEQGLKKALLTTDISDDMVSLAQMFNMLFDSGHDAQIISSSIVNSTDIVLKAELLSFLLQYIGYDNLQELSADAQTLAKILMELAVVLGREDIVNEVKNLLLDGDYGYGQDLNKILSDSFYMMLNKPAAYGTHRVDIIDDTAIIYFESFMENLTREKSFYTKLPSREDEETSTFAFFYRAFEEIQENKNVKNVVLDISNNGGGAAAALICTLGFLSEDGEAHFTHMDMLNQSYHDEYYHIDTNLDGIFDDEDGFGGEYNFYILTSGASYSCGNALPYFAQKYGQAAIIGQTPNGGDCVVGSFIDGYGRVGMTSGFLKIGAYENDTFVSNEKAVTIEKPFTNEEKDSIYFHPEAIAEYVHSIQ